jgi:hypothetical protein
MEHYTKAGIKLAEIIRKAMIDHVITTSEYEEIILLAHADAEIDPMEQNLLRAFHSMIAENAVRRVRAKRQRKNKHEKDS